MTHWHELFRPGGFQNGTSLPPAVYLRRTVYLRAVNALLARYGSAVRAVARNHADRNPCRAVLVAADGFDPATAYAGLHAVPGTPVLSDTPYQTAVHEAWDLNLDEYVETTLVIFPDYWDFEAALAKERHPAARPSHVYVLYDSARTLKYCTSLGQAENWLRATAGDGEVLPLRATTPDYWSALIRRSENTGEVVYVHRAPLN